MKLKHHIKIHSLIHTFKQFKIKNKSIFLINNLQLVENIFISFESWHMQIFHLVLPVFHLTSFTQAHARTYHSHTHTQRGRRLSKNKTICYSTQINIHVNCYSLPVIAVFLAVLEALRRSDQTLWEIAKATQNQKTASKLCVRWRDATVSDGFNPVTRFVYSHVAQFSLCLKGK